MRDEEDSFRAVIIGAMNFGGNFFQAWWPLIFYAADMAPYFTVSLTLGSSQKKYEGRKRLDCMNLFDG